MKANTFTGINIQFPISQFILSGEKSLETRTYKIPDKYIGLKLLLIETPGPNRAFKARIVGTIIFKKSFKYLSKKTFYKDKGKHLVDENSIWKWGSKPKWGWPIAEVTAFHVPVDAPKRKGIVFTSNIKYCEGKGGN